MIAKFPKGTFGRIAAALEDEEDRTDFVRAAVERELGRREKRAAGGEIHSTKPPTTGARSHR
jgi:hypothetical protein